MSENKYYKLLVSIFVAELGRHFALTVSSVYIYKLTNSGLFSFLFFVSSRIPKILFGKRIGNFIDSTRNTENLFAFFILLCSFVMFSLALTDGFSNRWSLIVHYSLLNILLAFVDISKVVIVKELFFKEKNKLKKSSVVITLLPNISMGVGSFLGIILSGHISLFDFIFLNGVTYFVSFLIYFQPKIFFSVFLSKKKSFNKNNELKNFFRYKDLFKTSALRHLVVEQLIVASIFGALPMMMTIYSSKITYVIGNAYNVYLILLSISSAMTMLVFKKVFRPVSKKYRRFFIVFISSILQAFLFMIKSELELSVSLTLFYGTIISFFGYFLLMSWYDAEVLSIVSRDLVGSITGAIFSLEVLVISLMSFFYGHALSYYNVENIVVFSLCVTSSIYFIYIFFFSTLELKINWSNT